VPARRPCLGPGPFHLAEPGDSRCSKHGWSGNWPKTSPAERGYGYDWSKIRRRVLAEEKRCRECGSTERLEVDHIRPKSEGGTHARSNLQVLCHRCHDRKTQRDLRRRGAPVPLRPRRQGRLTVVTGPPCGGKTTYVRDHAGPDDVVIDYDDICEALGAERYRATPKIKAKAQDLFVRKVDAARRRSDLDVWIVWADPPAWRLSQLRKDGAEVVLVSAPMAVCLERAAAERPATWGDAIRQWFRHHPENRSA